MNIKNIGLTNDEILNRAESKAVKGVKKLEGSETIVKPAPKKSIKIDFSPNFKRSFQC
jgi:lipocalin